MRVQRSNEHRLMPWANGLGVTAEIRAWPVEPEPWVWRLSIADVSADGPFSVFAGIDRHIIVIDGVGMGLTIDGGVEQRVTLGSQPLSFSGDAVTTCRLLDGPVSDLNLMVRRAYGAGALRVERVRAGHRINDADVAEGHFDVVAVVVLRGSLRVGGSELSVFDALVLEPNELMPTLVAFSDSIVAVAIISKKSPT